MSLAFVVMMPWGAFIARFMKMYWWWFPLHIFLQMGAVIFATIGFILIYLYKGKSGISHFENPHSIIGLTTLCLAWISPVLGLLSHFMWNPDRRGTPVFPDMAHCK